MILLEAAGGSRHRALSPSPPFLTFPLASLKVVIKRGEVPSFPLFSLSSPSPFTTKHTAHIRMLTTPLQQQQQSQQPPHQGSGQLHPLQHPQHHPPAGPQHHQQHQQHLHLGGGGGGGLSQGERRREGGRGPNFVTEGLVIPPLPLPPSWGVKAPLFASSSLFFSPLSLSLVRRLQPPSLLARAGGSPD